MTEQSAMLAALHAARRLKLDARPGNSRRSRNKAHVSPSGACGKAFARAAEAIFALLDKVPGLSVLRERVERDALERRCNALGRLEVRERHSHELAICR